MKIDLRKLKTYWINLKDHEQNATEMVEMLGRLGFENHERVPGIRVSGFEKRVDRNRFPLDYFMGVGLAQMNAIKTVKGSLPALVLEDDVKESEHFEPVIEVPDDADAVYLGLSECDKSYGHQISDKFARIYDMQCGHAIVYLSQKYTDEVMEVGKYCLINEQIAFDHGTRHIMKQYNVYAPLNPYFYQAASRTSSHKWEEGTKKPLNIVPKP